MKMFEQYLLERKHLLELDPITVTMLSVGASMATSLLSTIPNLWLSTLNNAAQRCSSILEPREKSKCMLNIKIMGKQKVLSQLRKARGLCKGEPRCVEKVQKKMKTETEHLKMLTYQLRNILRPQQL
jgi:hypothetical protein